MPGCPGPRRSPAKSGGTPRPPSRSTNPRNCSPTRSRRRVLRSKGGWGTFPPPSSPAGGEGGPAVGLLAEYDALPNCGKLRTRPDTAAGTTSSAPGRYSPPSRRPAPSGGEPPGADRSATAAPPRNRRRQSPHGAGRRLRGARRRHGLASARPVPRPRGKFQRPRFHDLRVLRQDRPCRLRPLGGAKRPGRGGDHELRRQHAARAHDRGRPHSLRHQERGGRAQRDPLLRQGLVLRPVRQARASEGVGGGGW